MYERQSSARGIDYADKPIAEQAHALQDVAAVRIQQLDRHGGATGVTVCVKLYRFLSDFIVCPQKTIKGLSDHSTVTDFARLRGLSTSVPRASAV